MIVYLVTAFVLVSPIVEPVRPFDRLEAAGYTNEAASLFTALHDDTPILCGDAAYHLRNKVDENDCPNVSEALSAAVDRADPSCVVSVLKLHLATCETPELLDKVYAFAKDAYQNHPKNTERSLALVILKQLYSAKGYDIFEESLETALYASSWHSRHGAFRTLLDSYSDRLCREDAERIYTERICVGYPEHIGPPLVFTRYLEQMRERLDNITFDCEQEIEVADSANESEP